VAVDAFGYAVVVTTGVEIVTDQTTTSDFALVALPRFDVTGTVRAAEDGSPLVGATVVALGTPVAPTTTDGSGAYTLNLPIGTYSLRASDGGCTEPSTQEGVELVDEPVSVDFALGRKIDRFGHGCRAIPFDWVDATTDTALYGDDFAGRLRLPFSYSFYGTEYDQVFISDNGYLNFLKGDVYNPFPVSIPSDDPPNAAIYALWRDLYLAGDSQVSYATLGSPGDRVFVIELSDVAVRGATSTIDVEVKLHEAGETVDILYGANAANPGDGRGATIGIENADGTDALEFSFGDRFLTPSVAFRYELVPSGIVHGTITDANDGDPIAGATVTAAPGVASARTAADGTYSLRLYPGSYDLGVSAAGYVSYTSAFVLADGGDVTRDAALAAPIPTVDPTDVSIELQYGDDPATTVLTLGNGGSADLQWEAKERSRGSTPPVIGGAAAGTGAWSQAVSPAVERPVNGGGTAVAHPKAYRWTAATPSADMSVLVYADDPVHPAPDTFVDQALRRLGLSYTAHYEADFEGFVQDLETGSWDLVIFAGDNYGPDFSLFDSLNAYVESGGRLIFHSWIVEFDPGHPLFERLGFEFTESVWDEPRDIHWWQPDHPAFTFPQLAPEWTELETGIYGVYGQAGNALPGAEAIAGYTTPGPDDGQAALIVANGERTAFRGFLDGPNSADLDGDGVPDGVELWENLAFGIGQGFFTDVPWLAESPTTGTVAAGDTTPVTLTIGDPGLAPGEYRASVVFVTNAPKPRTVTVDVTLTVALPDSWGAISGTVVDAHTGEPIAGVGATLHAQWNGGPLDVDATSAGDGTWSIIGPAGTWPLELAKPGYVTLTRDETVEAGTTRTGVDASLHASVPHGAIDGGPFTIVLTEGRTATRTVTLTNPEGHADLTFEVGEVNLGGGGDGDGGAAGATARGITGIAPNARTTKGGTRPVVTVPTGISAVGDVVASWPTEGLDLPWGVGFDGNVWISDPIDQDDLCSIAGVCTDTQFTPGGTPTGTSIETTFGEWGGDMAYDAGRKLLWQVSVGGDNGIYGLDPSDGTVVQVITGSPWDGNSQRGLAYDPDADVFYVGGWNEGVIYRVAGPSHPTPGETLGECSPPDPAISGLAWNRSFGMLWEATNSETDDIYLLDPVTCEASMAVAHPEPGFNGAGLELDAVGNLWTVSQLGTAYLVDSGLPLFSDVPWLAVSPESGSVPPDGSAEITLDVDTTGLEPGVYHAIVIVQTNDPELGNAQVPVTLVVPSYQQGVNAGGARHVDANGDVFAADVPYATGPYGFLGASSSRSTRTGIAGTVEDGRYQDLRLGMSGYRFAVPAGRYRVDLGFAEIVARKAGARVFSVAIEDATVIANLDLYGEVGRNAALDRSFTVEVTDGYLDIGFAAQRGDAPVVSSVLVTEVPEGSPDW
jgi:hypothetical protein